jgi:hypothetical protein
LYQVPILDSLILHKFAKWISLGVLKCLIDKGRVYPNNKNSDGHTFQNPLPPNTTILELQHKNKDGLDWIIPFYINLYLKHVTPVTNNPYVYSTLEAHRILMVFV